MDKGWSWVILAALFTTLMLMIGLQHSYGILFVEIQQRYDVTASMTSLVGSTFSVSTSVTGALVMTFALDFISERQCVMIGATLMTLSLSASFFATSFPVLVVTLGAISGSGAAFVLGPGFTLLGKYFRRHLTLAQAVSNTGMSVGGVLMPPLVRLVLDTFTFPAGLLVLGAVLAHLFVAASLLRPVTLRSAPVAQWPDRDEWDTGGEAPVRNSGTSVGNEGTPELCVCDNNSRFKQKGGARMYGRKPSVVNGVRSVDNTISTTARMFTSDDKSSKPPRDKSVADCTDAEVIDEDFEEHDLLQTSLLQQVKGRTYSDSLRDTRAIPQEPYNPLVRSASLHGVYGGDGDMKIEPTEHHVKLFLEKLPSSSILAYSSMPGSLSMSSAALSLKSKSTVSKCCSNHTLPTESHSKATCKLHADVCKSVVFWGLVVYQSLGSLGGILARVYLPPLARERQLGDAQAALLLSVVCGLDIFSRLLPAVVAQFKLMKTRTLIFATLVIQGILLQFTGLCVSFSALLGLCVVLGCLNGVFYSMVLAIIVEFMGLDNFAVSFGFIELFKNITVAAAYPMAGALKDATGTFVTIFHFLGASQLLAAACLASLPCISRMQAAREKTSRTTGDTVSLCNGQTKNEWKFSDE